jgi:hypothetical protein
LLRVAFSVSFCLVFACSRVFGQDVASGMQEGKVVTGTVSGHVICSDTNGPARFSKVFLKSVQPNAPDDDIFASLRPKDAKPKAEGVGGATAKSKLSAEDQAEQKATKAASAKFMSTLTDMMVSTTVGLEGSYLFTNVKPGTYYVHATVAGYIDPLTAFSAEDLVSKLPAMKQRIAAVATAVTVNGAQGARADLRVERGASISGRVLYDDGTPAAGWTVRTVHVAATNTSGNPAPNPFAALGVEAADVDLTHISEMSTTDDTGHYRIAGLPGGEYRLQARFVGTTLGISSLNPIATNPGSGMSRVGGMTDRMGLRLTVYSGDALRLADAKAISLRTGDDRAGTDLTMPLRSFHSVSGRVVAKTDAHPVNSGSVELTALDAAGKEDPSTHFSTSIHEDGTFRFDYVPGPITYTLKTSHPQDVTTLSTKKMLGSIIEEQLTQRRFGPASATVPMGGADVSDLTLVVAEMPAETQP